MPYTFSNNETGKKSSKFIRRIIVIGASTGGPDALKKIMKDLPADFETPIFIVWHMSAAMNGVLPQILNDKNTARVAHARDGEQIRLNRIYVAPPDKHLIIENNIMRITHGPKENRFRPAIDPLFRSAANYFGNRVIGVILSGALDDGTTGLWTIKRYGGITVVQDPIDAEVPSMPESALREVKIDYCLPASKIAHLLLRLCQEPVMPMAIPKDELTKKEIAIADEKKDRSIDILNFGELSPYTCPECHGVLTRLDNDNIIR